MNRAIARELMVVFTSFAMMIAVGLSAAHASAGDNRTIAGSVTDASARSVADCPVKLLRPSPAKIGPAPLKPGQNPTGDGAIRSPNPNQLQVNKNEEVVKEVKTDAGGKFTMTDIPKGSYTLLAGTGKHSV